MLPGVTAKPPSSPGCCVQTSPTHGARGRPFARSPPTNSSRRGRGRRVLDVTVPGPRRTPPGSWVRACTIQAATGLRSGVSTAKSGRPRRELWEIKDFLRILRHPISNCLTGRPTHVPDRQGRVWSSGPRHPWVRAAFAAPEPSAGRRRPRPPRPAQRRLRKCSFHSPSLSQATMMKRGGTPGPRDTAARRSRAQPAARSERAGG